MGIAKIRSILKGSPFYFLIFFLVATFQILEKGPYLITGNIHDQFLGINSGYFTHSGATNLLSPLGPVYHYFNSFSYSLVKSWDKVNRIGEIIPISSFLFCLLISVFFFITSFIVKKNNRGIDSLLLLVLLTISFSFRNLGNFELFDLNWYGTYNYHMFSLLVFNIFLSLYIIEDKESKAAKFVLLFFIQAIITSLALLYKINFGFANIVILAASILFSSKGKAFRLISFLGVGVLIAFLCSAILFSYPSYEWHLKALNSAFLARAETVKLDLLLYCFIGGGILYFSLIFSNQLNWEKVRQHCLNLKTDINLPYFLFSGSFSIALFLGIGGVWQQPKLLIVVTMLLILRRYFKSRFKLGTWFIAIFVLFNFYSNLLLTKYKSRDFSESFKYKTHVIPSDHLGMNLEWVTYNSASFARLRKAFVVNEDPLLYFKLSYSYNVRSGLLLPYSQGDYAFSINEGIQTLKEHGLDKNKKLMTIDFINPFSIFTQNKTTTPFWHWVHLGTTLAEGDELFLRSVDDAEVVMLRTISVDHNDQTMLNCFFYRYNIKKNNPFEIFHYSPYWVYLKRKDVGEPSNLQSDSMLNEAHQGCNEFFK